MQVFFKKKLGIIAGIDPFSASARMNQYEKGKHFPNYFILKKIAIVLSVPTAYFYAEDEELAELILLYEKNNNEDKQQILQFCKNLSLNI